MTTIDQLDSPQLLIDLDILDANLQRMRSTFADRPLAIRIHFKSLKCGGLARYLHGKGVPPDALVQISALEMSLARKAMLWDQAQAKAGTSNSTPRPGPSATRSLARGGASAGPVDPKVRRTAQARSRFAKSRSVEDAVALLNAQGD